jgi:predicted dehydrogenase
MSLEVSVVGAGKIGTKHARILSALPDVTIAGVVDVDAARAEELAATVDAAPVDLDTGVDADVVFVCTPDDEHVKATQRAIDAGCHTFVEKPLATTVNDADALLEATAASDAVHTVGHILRFDPRYRAVHGAMGDGSFGEIISVSMKRLVARSRARRTGAVSIPMRLGVHDFDLLAWITDERIHKVEAIGADGALRDEGYQMPDAVSVRATLADGVTATLDLGFCLPDGHPGSIVRTTVIGTAETAQIDASGEETQRWGTDGGIYVDAHLWPEIDKTPEGALAAEDRTFIAAVRQGGPSPVSFRDGRRAVAAAAAAKRSLEDGRRVTVE